MIDEMAVLQQKGGKVTSFFTCRSCEHLCWYVRKSQGMWRCVLVNAQKNPDLAACSRYEGRAVGLVWHHEEGKEND
jgi:hypothetical protein